MYRLFLFLVLIFGITAVANAQQVVTGVEAQARVVNLPEDGSKYHISLAGTPGEARYEQLRSWFQSDKALTQARAKAHYYELPTNGAQYTEKYGPTMPTTPCLRVQDAKGHIVYQVSGDNIPMSSQALTNAINAGIFRRRNCPDGNCGPQPAPAPVQPDVAPSPDVLPDTVIPDSAPVEPGQPWLLYGLAGLGGVAVGVYQWWKKAYFDNQ